MKNFQFKKRVLLLETYNFQVRGGKKHELCDYYVSIDFIGNDTESYTIAFEDRSEAYIFFDMLKKEIETYNFSEPLTFTLNFESFKLIKEPNRLVLGKY